MNYAQMSDFEINKEVAKALGATIGKSSFGTAYFKPDFSVSELSPGGPAEKFNPCNSWADSGPIIERERITLDSDIDVWFARDDNCCHTHENPLRAAMIVFLMMQEQK